MDIREFFLTPLSLCFVIPAGILCMAPMKHKFKCSRKQAVLRFFLAALVILPLGALFRCLVRPRPLFYIAPIMILFFFIYKSCVTASMAQAAAVFSFICVIMSVSVNLSYAVDAVCNPDSGALDSSMEFAVSSIALSTISFLLLYYLMSRYARLLIDHMQEITIWWITLPISGLFLFVNLYMAPMKYETLYVNNVFRIYLILQFMILFLEILLGTIFFHIVKSLLNLADLRVRTSMLEMQEQTFEKQQRYMEENARIRHDFKHTIRSLHQLAEDGNLPEIKAYLDEYISKLPENEVRIFCKNSALNAVLNYYRNQAIANNVETDFRIDLPSPKRLELDNPELCSMIGNILDNAIRAASAQPEGDRYIRLTTHVERNRQFYIVAVNSFDGQPLQVNGLYFSTRKKKSGLGLRSIATIVELHDGISNFHHEGTEFYTDIMIPLLPPDQEAKE
ncbi:MAG: sensor histidine kinase [Eubacterium sp.]|nr:sensor histidine kinase [Eubacterium sp.]